MCFWLFCRIPILIDLCGKGCVPIFSNKYFNSTDFLVAVLNLTIFSVYVISKRFCNFSIVLIHVVLMFTFSIVLIHVVLMFTFSIVLIHVVLMFTFSIVLIHVVLMFTFSIVLCLHFQ